MSSTIYLKDAPVRMSRKLDGKGRLILPSDLREAGGFAPDERVEVRLVSLQSYDGKAQTAFVITREEDEDGEETNL